MSKKILIVDDEASIRESLRRILQYEKYQTLEADRGQRALDLLEESRVDLVLLDIKMPGMDGLEALERMKASLPELPVIIISGHGTIQTAVEATRLGAYDFIEKPLDRERLLLTIRNGLKQASLTTHNRFLREEAGRRAQLVGENPGVRKVLEIIERVAPTTARVLIMGEHGTGKELVARLIHARSHRAAEPFVDVNCAAIPEELIESELFGHEKGSFTGALSRRIGRFEMADGGTLFLDEVGDMSLPAQAKVLRVLQENEFERVGGADTHRVDVRVLAATNKDLLAECQKGRFREDLFYRLNVVPIYIPPLRDRKSDIAALVEYFIQDIAAEMSLKPKKVSSGTLEAFVDYDWPGNVRELRNLLERLLIMCRGDVIEVDDLPPLTVQTEVESEDFFRAASYSSFKERTEREFLRRKLEENRGNVSRTARQLEMQRSNLYKKIEKYGLAREDGAERREGEGRG
jgi:two-component system nitrogen regulation response regulator NtrX